MADFKCVINVSTSARLGQRQPDAPTPRNPSDHNHPHSRMRGRRVTFPPILWNDAENGGKRDTPHSVYQSWVCGSDLLWNFILMPSSICQWMAEEVKEEGVVLEPAATLSSLLRCIIQCFSHNSLRYEGLSSPNHAAGSLLIWKKLRSHSVVPPGFLALHTLSHTCMIYSACLGPGLASMGWAWDPNRQVGKHFCPCQNSAAELGRGSVSASLWVVRVTLE